MMNRRVAGRGPDSGTRRLNDGVLKSRQNRERGYKMTRTVVAQALADIVEDKSKATEL